MQTKVPVRSTLLGVCLSLAGLLAASAPLLAHHSAAAFDAAKEITLQATVTEWHWSNPHCLLEFEAKDDTEAVRHWVAETGNPTGMTRRGWSRTMFTPGSQITVRIKPARNGEPLGLLLSATLPDGRQLDAGEGARIERSRREAEAYKTLGANPGESNR